MWIEVYLLTGPHKWTRRKRMYISNVTQNIQKLYVCHTMVYIRCDQVIIQRLSILYLRVLNSIFISLRAQEIRELLMSKKGFFVNNEIIQVGVYVELNSCGTNMLGNHVITMAGYGILIQRPVSAIGYYLNIPCVLFKKHYTSN